MSYRRPTFHALLRRRAAHPLTLPLVAVLTASLLAAVPIEPAAAERDKPWSSDIDEPVRGRPGTVKPRRADPSRAATVTTPPKVTWPTADAAEVPVAAAPARQGTAGAVGRTATRIGGLPVAAMWTSAPEARAATNKLPPQAQARVRTFDRATSQRAGVSGPVLRLALAQAGKHTGKIQLAVGYRDFEAAYGGDYGPRLRLVRLPTCALTTPQREGCRTATPIRSTNDTDARTVTGEIDAPAAGSASGLVLAMEAGDSSSQGSYAATTLAPSSSWNVALSSGGYSWSYPMKSPPVPGDLQPSLSLDYSSQTTDGRTAATNNQGSWVGEGFSYEPGFIERRYKSCIDDGHTGVGDLCWAHQNASISFGGRSGDLVKVNDNVWKLPADDGSTIERKTGATNGDNDGEYWILTTADGTQYFFGINRLPGWTGAAGQALTNSAWSAPVYGDDANEPCHKTSGLADSYCDQAWRWNLDHVKDRHGNVISYFYDRETNYYARGAKFDVNGAPYHRGGYLKRIDYGQRHDKIYTTNAPARVQFTTAERCLEAAASCEQGDLNKDTAARWPDVPFELNCAANTHCDFHQATPSFWTRKRLTKITTEVRSGARWLPVNSWALSHEFKNNGDASRSLWLSKITQTGHRGDTDISLPPVAFVGMQMANRINRPNDHISDLFRFRLKTIHNGTGGQIDINYAPVDCSGGALPEAGESTKRCFPVRWNPLGTEDPITDWFHKYVVAEVIETDRTGGNPDMVTRYEYADGAGWRKAKPDGITDAEDLTWSDWRGYGTVTVRRGDAQTMSTRTEHTFLRGMHGDPRPSGGTRSVTVRDSTGEIHTDHDELSGHELETVTYNGSTVVSKTISTPWLHHTHTHTETWGTSKSSLTRTGTSRTLTALKPEDGQLRWRETKTVTAFDATWGRPTRVDDQGDIATAADDRCTRNEYLDNPTKHLQSFVSRTETVAVSCAIGNPNRATQVLTDTKTSYDGLAHGTPPTTGDVTKVEELKSHDGATATYIATATTTVDIHGRPVAITDALQKTTRFDHTETDGLTTRVQSTNPLGQTNARELDVASGDQVAVIDANDKRTDFSYDGLGRLVGAWLPNRPKSGDRTPSIKHTYLVRENKPVVIKSEKLKNDGSYRAAYQLYDAFLRTRQTQTEGPDKGWLLTDTRYTSTGQIDESNDAYLVLGTPGDLPIIAPEGSTNGQTSYVYDGADRVTAEVYSVAGDERWRVTSSYDGDRIHVDPPTGGTPATTVIDARGQTTEFRQYHGSSPTGTADITRYAYTAAGALATVTDTASNVWRYTYNHRNEKITAQDPDAGTTTYTYDDLGRLASATDGRGKTLSHVYDSIGRKTQTWQGPPDTGTKLATWTYDTGGYKGQLHWSARYVDGKPYGVTTTARDAFYRPQRVIYSIPAEAGAKLAGTYQFNTVYNTDDTVQSVGMPEAGKLPSEVLVMSYDDLLRPKALTGNSPYVTAASYTTTGQLRELELNPSGKKAWLRWDYERGTGRLVRSRLDRQSAAAVDIDATYKYDAAGNIQSVADTPAGGQRDIQCFDYDHLRRLTEAWATANTSDDPCTGGPAESGIGGPAPYHESWTFDAIGNRRTESRRSATGGAPVTREYHYPDGGAQPHTLTRVDETGPAGPKTYGYAYDASGNTTSRNLGGDAQNLTWDSEGHLASVTAAGKTTSFVYDADGSRLLRKEPGATTLYLPGTELRFDHAANTVAGTRFYSFNGTTVAVRSPDGLHLQAADHHGTTTTSIDAATGTLEMRRTTPYGGQRGTQPGPWPDQKGFVGGTQDPTTGLTHLGAREYDPTIGRFISVDPIADYDDPQQIHGYAYSNNSPVTNSDPTGLLGSASCTGGTVGGPGGCTGSEDGNHPDSMAGAGSQSTTTILRNGTVLHQNRRGRFINNVNVSEALQIPQAPTYRELGAGVDRYVGEHRPGEDVNMYEPVITWNLIWLATAEYRLDDLGRFTVHAHNGDPELLATSLTGTMVGSFPLSRGGMRSAPGMKLPSLGCHSFDPGTPVLMADGQSKKIKDIELNDEVLSADEDSVDMQGERKVVALHANAHDGDIIDVQVGAVGSTTTPIRTTAEHLFWDETAKEWVPAGRLATGHTLRTDDGESLPVRSVRTRPGAATMFDLTIEGLHTYYVMAGSDPVLVHNCNKKQGVYVFVNILDGLLYVGQAADFNDRLGKHKRKGKRTSDGHVICIHVCGDQSDREIIEDELMEELGGKNSLSNSIESPGRKRRGR